MNEQKFYISYKRMPPRIPLMATLFWWMFLDYTNAPGWLFGVVGTIMLFAWVAFIYVFLTHNGRDVFDS